MRAAIQLGLRLAFQAEGAGRVRSILVASAAATGSMILLTATALSHADVVGSPDRYDQRMGFGWLSVAVVVGIGLPVLVLAATVGRLSASMRDRRLSNLRLLGLSPFRTRMVAIAETGVAAMAGSLLGAALFYVVRPLLTHVPIRGRTYPTELITPWPLALSVIVIGVPAAVAGVSSLPQRLDTVSALRRARRADAKRPGWWRLVPLATGATWCAYFSSMAGTTQSDLWLSVNLIGSIITLGLGMLLVLPVAVRLMGDVLLLLARGPATTMAARRIQAQPAGVTRVISGLLIGLFLVTGARCVIVAFESTPQYIAAEHAIKVQQQVELSADLAAASELATELAAIPGVRGVIEVTRLVAHDGCGNGGTCLTGIVLSCADLARIAPGVTGCRDGEALWLTKPEANGPATALWRNDDNLTGVEIPLPRLWAGGDLRYASIELGVDVIIPPTSPELAGLERSQVAMIVLSSPGHDLMEKVSNANVKTELGLSGYDAGEYDFVKTVHSLVWAIATIILSLGLVSFAISAVDRAIARRREVVALQIAGVPRGVLRRAQWLEAAIPIGIGSVIAVALGIAAGATYLTLDPAGGIPWTMGISLAMLATAGAVAVAGLTVIAASPAIQADLIRTE